MNTKIMSDFELYMTAGKSCDYVDMDSQQFCIDTKRFFSYPHTIHYQFNSRGFRDAEWPDSLQDLQNAIWCVGDSFTMGLGAPLQHTWPYLLQQATGIRTINVSMNGASNMWMSRRIVHSIFKEVTPKITVIQWSFLHRRELAFEIALEKKWQEFYNSRREPLWPPCPLVKDINTLPTYVMEKIKHDDYWQSPLDSDRLLHVEPSIVTEQDDIDNAVQCIQSVESNKSENQMVIHSFVPHACPIESVQSLQDRLTEMNLQSIGIVNQIDWSRDGLHYDIETSKKIVDDLVKLIHRPI